MHARYILTVYNQTKYMQDIDIIRYRYYQCTHNGQKQCMQYITDCMQYILAVHTPLQQCKIYINSKCLLAYKSINIIYTRKC